MKLSKKLIATFSILFTVFLLHSCGGSGEKTEDGHDHDHDSTAAHEHIYACPMHPEVQGHEGEKCSKCGMALEHNDNALVPGNFKMKFTATAEPVEAGKKVSLNFTPQNLDKPETAVPLEVQHEKKIHLILVSDDLSWFDHIHPEYQSDGSYKVDETFPAGGNYLLFADYMPSGSGHQLEKISLAVKGKSNPPKTYTQEITTAQSTDGISLQLKPDAGKFTSGGEIHFDGILKENGKQIEASALDNFLGAKAHSVMIGTTDKQYMHVHPEVEKSILHFHTTFEKPGIYRCWVQFSYKGKLHTTDFTLKVEAGESTMPEHEHGKEHSH